MCRISCAMSNGVVSILLFVSLRHSRGVFAEGLNIFLCILLGLRLSKVRYFVMVFFTVNGGLFSADFVGFYLGCAANGG